MPGIEPGPPGWKPEILATRPHGMGMSMPKIENVVRLVINGKSPGPFAAKV